MSPGAASRRARVRVHVSGVLDGSRAMQLVEYLRRERAAEVVVDFVDVEGFESFGVDLLLGALATLTAQPATVRVCAAPPCVAERLDEIGIAVSSSVRHPRWAPWAP